MKLKFILMIGSVAFIATSPAFAQQDSSFGDDIIVTAQKRETSLQKTAISMSVLSGEALRDQQIGNVSDLAQSMPSVNFGQTTGNARIAIRGVGFDNISVGNEGRVAFHVNGVYISRPSAALAGFYDVQRVEVLRGPQGTLYGRNATGGAINVILAGPTDFLDGYVDASYGNYNNLKLEGAVGGPITDILSARVSFSVVERDGYGKNRTNNFDVDDQSTRAIRGQLRIRPSDAIDIHLEGDYFHEKDHAYGWHLMGPGSLPAPATATTPALPGIIPKGLRLGGTLPANPRDNPSDIGPFNNREFWGFAGTVNADLGGADLTSITGYRYARFHSLSDFDGTEVPISAYDQMERSRTFSQELRLSGDFDRGEWMLGGYYFHESLLGGTRVALDPLILTGSNDSNIPLPAPTSIRQGLTLLGTQKTNAFAGFANVKYELVDNLSLRVGARYSHEKKAVVELNGINMAAPYPPVISDVNADFPGARHSQQNATWKSFTPSITLEYQATGNLFTYVTYSKGFKSGGFNLGNIQPAFAPEKITSYEGGIRADWLNGLLRTNVSGFYYDYKNLQVSQVVGAAIVIQNAATARLYGMEAEVTAHPMADLNLSGGLSLLHSEYRDFVSIDPARAALGPINLAGNRLTQAPTYTLNLSADYTVHSKVGDFNLRGEGRFVGRNYFSQYNLANVSQPGHSLFNAFLTWKGESGLNAGLYVRNIANKRIISSALVSSTLVGAGLLGTYEPPRTYGASLGYKF